MGPFGFYYFDYTYFLFVIPALIVTMAAQIGVKTTFAKYSRVRTFRGMTGAQAAEAVARCGGAQVRIQQVAGSLTDNFDPRNHTISLSRDVYAAQSIAAVGVAAHEAGHAVQDAEHYLPNRIRAALVPVTNIGSQAAMPLILIGLILPVQYNAVVYTGILLYGLVVLFELVTLPVELNASHRAVRALDETGILTPEELAGAKKVLTAAAMTYLAATFAALLTLLRFLLIAGSRRSDD
jgi:Zn-dependent membrane protease YugP